MSHEEKTKFFEDNYKIFENELEKRRRKWTLKANLSLDFEDVKQICLKHIFIKLGQFDEEKGKLTHWTSRIITNQIKNILRNNFTSCARPCIQNCWFNAGGDSCLYTPSKVQCSECPVYKIWEDSKKIAFEVKMPLPIENHVQEVYDIPNSELDYDRAEKKLHEEMRKNLKANEWRVYELMIIQHLEDKEIAKVLKLKTNEKHRPAGYGTLIKMKKLFIKKAKKIKDEHDLF